MNALKCSLVQCLTRNLQAIWNWLDKIGIIPLFRTAGNDLIPKSPTQALAIIVKLYVAMVISIWIYRKIGQKYSLDFAQALILYFGPFYRLIKPSKKKKDENNSEK